MEDRELMVLLLRLESAAAEAARADGLDKLLRIKTQSAVRAEMHLMEARKSEGAMERKLEEWIEYAGLLRSAIDAIDPRAVRSKKIVLPERPTPLEAPIPF